MRILAVDIGTGTQDILLFDSEQPIQNSVQLVAPSPTLIVAENIRRATRKRRPLVLMGEILGGGPCAWAAEDHLRAGLPLYATPDAARTFDDDLDKVSAMGVKVVTPDQAQRIYDAKIISLHDLSLDAINVALRAFDVEPTYDAVAVAVFDHGEAPPTVSDRTFRFQYLAERLRDGALTDFAFTRDNIPPSMTRLRAVAHSVPPELPLLVMDTAPAAVLGALDDPLVEEMPDKIVVNIGNFHTLAFHLVGNRIVGLFEHHTGEINALTLEGFLARLAAGTLTNEEIYDSQGHGAIVFDQIADSAPQIAITGPRQHLLFGSSVRPYRATPHGAMMLAGCFGLLRSFAVHFPAMGPAITAALNASMDGR
jgi:uncharacterized protein (DUF1786 family)